MAIDTHDEQPLALPVHRELRLMLEGGLSPAFQPIVDLRDDTLIGYEALARGPVGSPLEMPGALFAAARRAGMLAEMDQACLMSACRAASRAGLCRPRALFVNVEAEVIDAALDPGERGFLLGLLEELDIFIEVTERSLTGRPAQLLETVERLRDSGFRIALDDVGADPRSLALLPLLRPDVIKLDITLLHDHPSRRSGDVLNGVAAYAEQTGALILAEGVEGERDAVVALSLGASLAQGWHFGRPGPLGGSEPRRRARQPLDLPERRPRSSPFELLDGDRPARVASKEMLISMTRSLEAQAADLREHGVVAAAFQDARHFTDLTRRRYERLARRASLIVGLGEGFSRQPATGVHGADLPPDDPLQQQWVIAVLGPHYAAALVARDLGDSGPEAQRRFAFVLTFDRQLVSDVAASLIGRLSTMTA